MSAVWAGVRYLLLATAAFIALSVLGRQMLQQNLWVLVVATLCLAVPLFLALAYRTTVRRLRVLQGFAHQGYLYRLLATRWLRLIFWAGYAVIVAYGVLVQMAAERWQEQGLLFATIPVFGLAVLLSHRLLQHELQPFLLTERSLALARWLTVGVLLSVGIVLAWQTPAPATGSLQEALALAESRLVPAPTALGFLGQYGLAALETLPAYALSSLGQSPTLNTHTTWLLQGLLLVLLAQGLVLHGLTLLLSTLCLPAPEWRRLLGPLTHADTPAPLGAGRCTSLAIWAVLILGFVAPSAFTGLENTLAKYPPLQQARERHQLAPLIVERIGEELYREGTLAQVAQLQQARTASSAALRHAANQGFDTMAANIEHYLDWYYSLGGEYGRLMAMLSSGLEAYMRDQLNAALQTGQPFAALGEQWAQASPLLDDNRFRQQIEAILEQNRLEVQPGERLDLTTQISLADFWQSLQFNDNINFNQRLAASASGALGALVAGQVVAKAMSKGIIQLASKSVAKAVASKAATPALTGLLGGAATGSLFTPGIGTVIGAITGVFLGITIDSVVLHIEESLSREEHRQSLLNALNDVRAEFMRNLEPIQAEASPAASAP